MPCGCATVEQFCRVDLSVTDSGPKTKQIYGKLDSGGNQPLSPHIIIEANKIFHNNRGGLRVRGSSPLLISKCKVYRNGRAGLRLEHQADVLIRDSSISMNETGGMDIVSAKRVELIRTKLFKNLAAGIRIRSEDDKAPTLTRVHLTHSRIFLNGQAGVFVSPSPGAKVEINLSECEIFQNRKSAVRIQGSTMLTARGNMIFSNGRAGLFAISRDGYFPVMDVFENRIFFNTKAGIIVQGGVTGGIGITNNWIYNNYESGIVCGIGKAYHTRYSSLGIYHNTIVANGSGFEGAGIRNDSNSTMDIQNNIIAYNLRTGILTYRCRDASHNLLFANGQDPQYIPDKDYAFLIRRLQYGGCPATGSGDILADPLFTAPDRYDFTLSDRSPAKGAANRLAIPYLSSFGQRDMGSLLVPAKSDNRSGR